MSSTPVLHLLAGPNGAGKSTFAQRVLLPATGLPFINADVIAAKLWPDAPEEHSYAAAREATTERERLLDARRSFVTETVFSHRSKVTLVESATARGYLVHLHVVMVPVGVSIGRVDHRVRHGGHAVPEEKIRERSERLWGLVVEATQIADRATFYDNSNDVRPFRTIAAYERGRPLREPAWPSWTPTVLRTGLGDAETS